MRKCTIIKSVYLNETCVLQLVLYEKPFLRRALKFILSFATGTDILDKHKPNFNSYKKFSYTPPKTKWVHAT
jgi:hypothetical protein